MKTDGAIYHYSGKVVTRSVKGEGGARVSRKSAVAAAAYQAGERLVLEMERNPFGQDMQEKMAGLVIVHDYRPKAGDVAFKEICAPEGAPSWVFDRQTLWNKVEAAEKRVDAQVCRQLDIALPRSLTHDQRIALVRDFVGEAFTAQGMIADVAFHYDTDNHNPHCHILLTTRKLEGDGFASAKCKEWQPNFAKVGYTAIADGDRRKNGRRGRNTVMLRFSVQVVGLQLTIERLKNRALTARPPSILVKTHGIRKQRESLPISGSGSSIW
jgi:MobA/MobL family